MSSLHDALNLPEVQKKETLPAVIDQTETSDDLEIDYKEARNNLKDVIGKGKEALENLLTIGMSRPLRPVRQLSTNVRAFL
jgi:hypothetical protein